MKVQYENSSSKKMRQLIKKTFAELVQEKKDVYKITVTELVNKAEISRGTFYTHYDDIFDVIQDFEMETIELVTDENLDLKSINDILQYFDNIKKCIEQNESIYRKLLSADDTILFLNRLRKIAYQKISYAVKTISKYPYDKYTDLELSILLDGLFAQVIKYLKDQSDYNLEDLIIVCKKWIKKF